MKTYHHSTTNNNVTFDNNNITSYFNQPYETYKPAFQINALSKRNPWATITLQVKCLQNTGNKASLRYCLWKWTQSFANKVLSRHLYETTAIWLSRAHPPFSNSRPSSPQAQIPINITLLDYLLKADRRPLCSLRARITIIKTTNEST